MKKISVLILIFLVALSSLFILSSSAADDFVIENGILLSYTGNAKTVSIPESVYYIADGAFKGKSEITSVNLHSSVTSIGNEAFYGCTSLAGVSGGDGVSSVGAYAFYGTPYINNNDSEVITLNSVAIGGKPKGKFIISDEISAIAPYAFAKNTSITSIEASTSLNSIGEGAFFGCSGVTQVSVGDSLSYIGALAFQGTDFMNTATEEFLVMGDGILVKYNANSTNVTIPSGVKQIGDGAFYGNKNITSVTIPDSVVYIGMRSFMNCSSLTNVTLGDKIRVIEKEAFAKCKALKKATVPESVLLIGDSVYYGCSALDIAEYKTSVSMPDGMFAQCENLRCVILNHNVSSIGNSAFADCKSLTDIAVPDSVAHIGKDAFDGADSVTVSCNKKSYANSYCTDNSINTVQSGDANLDGKVNIRDATYIQKYAASLVTFTSLEKLRAEANFDGKINIRDATYIQKLLAGLV